MEAYWKLTHGCYDYRWLYDGLAGREGAIYGIDPRLGCALCTPFVVCVGVLLATQSNV